MLALPGVGPYTAGALRAFALNRPAVLVDGNIARVLSRLSNDRRPIDDSQRSLPSSARTIRYSDL